MDNPYVTAGANRLYANQNLDNPAGVYVFSSQGRHLGTIPVPEDMVTNCTFGDADLKTLYVTGGQVPDFPTPWQPENVGGTG